MQPQHETGNVTPIGSKPAASVITVGPDTAQRWLECNPINRNIRQKRVDQYSRDMLAGEWALTGEPIKFSKDGRLLDGQHRLWAIVLADVTLTLFVVRGLEEATQSYMDAGAARSAGDALALDGEPYAAAIAAAARLGIAFDAEARGHKLATISTPEVFEWVNNHPGLRDTVATWHNQARRTGLPGTVLNYCAYRLSEIDEEACSQFFTGLATHVNLPDRSPILALATRLSIWNQSRITVRHRERVLLVFRAWNYWRTNRGIKQFKLPRSDEQIPQPV